MIEVEIRAKVDNFKEVRINLDKIGAKIVDKVRQVDRTFGHPQFLDKDHQIFDGGFSARIRQVDNDVKIDWKEICRDKKHGMQITAPVVNVDIGIEFLQKMGWEEAFTVDKARETFKYDDFKICLDNVERLGTFIEIEKTIDSRKRADQTREDCKELLKKIAPKAEIIRDYYGDMMFRLVCGQKKE